MRRHHRIQRRVRSPGRCTYRRRVTKTEIRHCEHVVADHELLRNFERHERVMMQTGAERSTAELAAGVVWNETRYACN